ncbi:MAG TPA: MarR family transcriptional regulator [Xanthobacteraceae bacterium]|nr:MarR family transcriptional regulator [Xanthobacteraceae bacterium]
MHARETAELLIQAARVAQAARTRDALTPAEWMALRFFARANPQSRKPSALADFGITSRAAASQVVNRLEQGGYITRVQSPKDRRSYRIDLTAKGHGVLRDDPIEGLVGAVQSLDAPARAALHDALRRVVGGLAASGRRRQFDTCRHCLHLSDVPCECGLFGATINSEAAHLLCAHFRPRTA